MRHASANAPSKLGVRHAGQNEGFLARLPELPDDAVGLSMSTMRAAGAGDWTEDRTESGGSIMTADVDAGVPFWSHDWRHEPLPGYVLTTAKQSAA